MREISTYSATENNRSDNNLKFEKTSVNPVSNIYRMYTEIDRERPNNRYNLRNITTKAICNVYKGNRSEIYAVSSSKSKINTSHQKKNNRNGIYTCGNCHKKFDDRDAHIVESPHCSKYNTRCTFCNNFYCGIDGLKNHLKFQQKSGKTKINLKSCACMSWITSKLQPKVSIDLSFLKTYSSFIDYDTVLLANVSDTDDDSNNNKGFEEEDNDNGRDTDVDNNEVMSHHGADCGGAGGGDNDGDDDDNGSDDNDSDNDNGSDDGSDDDEEDDKDKDKNNNEVYKEDDIGKGDDGDNGKDSDDEDRGRENDDNDDANDRNDDDDVNNGRDNDDNNENEDGDNNDNDGSNDNNNDDGENEDDNDDNSDNGEYGGGNNMHSRRCSRFGCKTCPLFEVLSSVSSPFSKIQHSTINHDFPIFMDCNSSNVVYLLICNNCGLMYVGQTGRWLKIRIGEHLKSIKLGKGGCPYLIKHFNTGPCKGSKFSVCILEKLPGSGIGRDGKVDKEKSIIRRKKETEWMLRLRTVYPYGMNHDVGKNLEEGDLVVGTLFPKLSKRKQSISNHRRFRPRMRTCFNLTDFISFVNNTLQSDLKNAAYKFRTAITSLKKCHLKALHTHFLTNSKNTIFKQWYKMGIDLIETKLYKPLPPKVKRKAPKYQLKCLFANKAFDFINLPKILRTKSILDLMPAEVKEDEVPMLVFKLTEPIRSTIMNYSNFVSKLDIDEASLDISSVPCNCSGFDAKYVNTHFNHVLTGDLDIIRNHKLRNLILKGPKYREPETVNFWGIRDQIDDCLSQYIEQISKTKKIAEDKFLRWKNEVLEFIDKRIADVSERFQPKEVIKVLEDPNVKNYLKSLHKSFVFCPTDKAGNNVAIICKQLYARNILKEIDLVNINNNSAANTYCRVDECEADIVERHCLFQSKFSLDVEDDMRKLPPFHWTPKMHKQPTGARYIIGSKMSSLKPLGKALTKIFKVIFHHKRRFCMKAGFFSGLKQFWCIDNHNEVLNTLKAK